MKRFIGYVRTGAYMSEDDFTFEVEDDATFEEIREAGRKAMLERIEWGYHQRPETKETT